MEDVAGASRARSPIARRAGTRPEDREAEVARVLLVQACEESDRAARFLPRAEREVASREARQQLAEEDRRTESAASSDDGERFALHRAARLAAALERRHPALHAARAALRLRLPGPPVLAATLAAGFAADALGGERRVNLLAFPLLALLAWNASVYLLLLLSPLLARRQSAAGIGAALARLGAWLAARRLPGGRAGEARWLAASLRRFTTLWSALAGRLLATRVRKLLHVGALGFAVGLVGGMYVRGLAFEYRASWESTFLDAPAASRLLSLVLGPAAHLLDAVHPGARPRATELLDARSLAALRGPGGDGPAAIWIHLWALTAGVGIVLPRAGLAWHEARRARHLAADLRVPLDAPYFLRLCAAERGAGTRVAVWPYSHRLSTAAGGALREMLHELFGNRARIEVDGALPYGAEPPALPPGDAPPDAVVIVFNLAQSPEQEVHGAFLEALGARLAPAKAEGAGARGAIPHAPSVLVLLDEESYRARLDGTGGDRLGQRRRAWERIARSADLRCAALRPLAEGADDTLAEARAALAAASGEAA